MNDTAGLIKDLVWEGDYSRTAKTPFGNYSIGDGEAENQHTFTFHTYPYGIPSDEEFEGIEGAKTACQSDYEARILSALNLDAFKARIRKEVNTHLRVIEYALRAHHKFQSEFGITYAKDDEGIYHEIDMSDGYGDSTLCEQTWEALKHSASIRALLQASQEDG